MLITDYLFRQYTQRNLKIKKNIIKNIHLVNLLYGPINYLVT